MKIQVILLFVIFINTSSLFGQTGFEKVSDPFILDTEKPQLTLIEPSGDTNYFVNDSIQVKWLASDESFGNNPISIGLSVEVPDNFVLQKENIPNTDSSFILTTILPADSAKVNIIAIDSFGLISEVKSDDYFELLFGYSELTFSEEYLDFGPIPVIESADTAKSLWLRNEGNKELNIYSLYGIEEPFSSVLELPAIIWPGDSIELNITLNQDTPLGIYYDTIVLVTMSKGYNYIPIKATLYSTLPQVDLGQDITKCAISTITISATAIGGVPPYSYLWNTGSTDSLISISDTIDKTFIIAITDQLGITDSDTIEVFIQQVYQGEEICIVTVDSVSQKNIVIWQRTSNKGTEYYKIYYSSDTLPLQAIDTILFDDTPEFIDQNSIPNQQPYGYCISAVDSCGNESFMSSVHRSIHLQTNQGFPSGVNLSWTSYEGFSYNNFYIFRVLSNGDTAFIAKVDASTNTFSDFNPPPLVYSYRVTVEKDYPCYPDSLLSKTTSGPFKQSLSNIGDNYFINYQFQVKAFLEGVFNDTSMFTELNQKEILPRVQPFNIAPWNYDSLLTVDSIPNPYVVDWVLLELRKSSSSFPWTATSDSTILQQPAFILNNGEIVNLDGASKIILEAVDLEDNDNNIFVVVRHRNHIGIMSNWPMQFSENDVTFSYDFTDLEYKVYGFSSHKEIETGIWGMIAGDANSDGMINSTDVDSVWNINAGKVGYEAADINLDGNINNIDKNDFWVPNEGKGCQVPD